jgi:hypothetical protein
MTQTIEIVPDRSRPMRLVPARCSAARPIGQGLGSNVPPDRNTALIAALEPPGTLTILDVRTAATTTK